MSKIAEYLSKNKFTIYKFLIGLFMINLIINTTVPAYASFDNLFDPLNDMLKKTTILLVDKIVNISAVIGILIILINIIFSQVSGEHHSNIGKKILWIFGLIFVAIFANWLKANGVLLFNN
jgi:hypothetical protein